MPSYKFASAAALLATAGTVAAVGSTKVTNQCSYPVYLWSVAESAGMMHTLNSNGGSYSEAYRTNGDGGGISIKIANSTTLGPTTPVTQFEYTLDGNIWYDISNINGYPFQGSGLTLTPSDASCPKVACAAGVSLCSSVYNQPDDNQATSACAATADLDMVLCPGGNDSDPAPAAPPAPKPKKKKTPAPKPAPEPAPEPTEQQPKPAPAPTKPAPAPAQPTDDTPAVPVVTTMVTQVVTQVANADAAAATPVDTDWWIGHYPASWASFPVPTIDKREAEPTAHVHHHHYAPRHFHGHRHHRR